jgi:hypothetical protein
MSRLTLFTVVLLVLVAIGAQPRQSGGLTKSLDSMCVCVPARAGLIMKSAIARTQAQVRSAELFTHRATVAQ